MKKLYIIGLMGLGLAANAQKAKMPTAAGEVVSTKTIKQNLDYDVPSPVRVSDKPATTHTGYNKMSKWAKVGATEFDRQTNSSVYRRIQAYPGGKVSVIWTTSTDGSNNNFLGRGSGYNHFNGTTWGPVGMDRIETVRTGYPNFDFDGSNEIIISHKVDTSGRTGGLALNANGAVGGTTWTTKTLLPPLPNQSAVMWPRTAIANGYMHILASYTGPGPGQTDTVKIDGVYYPTVYSRYKLADSTMEIENIMLPGYDSSRWTNGGADGYSLAARGNTVAIVMGGITDDISLWKSTDNGDTWVNTIIDSFPVPAWDEDVDTIAEPTTVCDATINVNLDSNGNVHCFWGRYTVQDTIPNDDLITIFPGTNAIDYWYEGRPDSINLIGAAFDESGNGTLNIGQIPARSRYGNSGVATMPYSTIDENGRIFVVYSALTDEDNDGQGAGYRDIYVVTSSDLGATWSFPVNLTAFVGLSTEQMFGSAVVKDGILHLTYMESTTMGFYVSTTNPGKIGPFDIMYLSVPVADIDNGTVGVNEVNKSVTVGTNYPNPFHNNTIIPVSLTEKADIKVTVMNILGEVVYTSTHNNTTVGVNNIEVNGNFKSGFYFYNVEAAGVKVSGKMLAE